ncbi:hypothetical protein O9H85_06270 [Paenibacillus filicis]|uniref:Uncharacterized protein n=1 Tax=Paenibacillus gyeongsangnamensis TaxID=3388067 RepID=A0ABT4Q583_9BACL|nr:hypothetical protein [Paenibacillus filicis]MCZ8512037.1 hypothetical protein [Paenibacillus filicis]
MKRKRNVYGKYLYLSLALILALALITSCESGPDGRKEKEVAAKPAAATPSSAGAGGSGTPLKPLSGDVLSLTVEHPKMKAVIGEPAILSPGDDYPRIKLKPKAEGHGFGSCSL